MLRGLFSNKPGEPPVRRATSREVRAAATLQRKFRIKASIVVMLQSHASFGAAQRSAATTLLLQEKMYIVELQACLDMASRAVRPSGAPQTPPGSDRVTSEDTATASADPSGRSLDGASGRSTQSAASSARPAHLTAEQVRGLRG